jgi:Cys-rich four helix bundle protein (predicted Tat secretion target)
MNRRELLELSTAVAVATASAAVGAADLPAAAAHAMHDMPADQGQHDHAATSSKYSGLMAATSRCVDTGDTCLAHCLTLLGEGDKSLAACAKSVRDTIAACSALRQLASTNSPHVPALAKVVGNICRDCAAECRKHDKHQVCRDCAAACTQCEKECVTAAA